MSTTQHVFTIVVGILLFVLTVSWWSSYLQRKDACEFAKERLRWRVRDRDDYLKSATNYAHKNLFREQRANEDPWEYSRDFATTVLGDACVTWPSLVRRRTRYMKTPRSIRRSRKATHEPCDACTPSWNPWNSNAGHGEGPWVTIILHWWSATIDGVTHRVVKLQDRHTEGDASLSVLWCETSTVTHARVDTHIQGQGPLITCLTCLSKPL